MKFRIKNKGMTELLLILPLFLGLACFIGWTGFLMIHKSRIEKHAWVTQIEKTYEIKSNPEEINPKYKIKSNHSATEVVDFVKNFTSKLPTIFGGYIALHSTKFKTLTINDQTTTAFERLHAAAFQENGNTKNFQFSADMMIPGDPMNGAGVTKLLMWQESMKNSGFGATYPLQMLGIMELLGISGLPVDKLGGFAGLIGKSQKELEEEAIHE